MKDETSRHDVEDETIFGKLGCVMQLWPMRAKVLDDGGAVLLTLDGKGCTPGELEVNARKLADVLGVPIRRMDENGVAP